MSKTFDDAIRAAFMTGWSFGVAQGGPTNTEIAKRSQEEAFKIWRRGWAETPIPDELGETQERTTDVSGAATVECICPPSVGLSRGKHNAGCPQIAVITKGWIG